MRAPYKIGIIWMALAGWAQAQVLISQPMPTKDQSTSSTGSAVPATASFAGVVGSGNLAGIVACDNSALLTVSTAVTTQIVALSGTKSIYICSLVINGAGATTGKLVVGTGTNCAVGLVSLTPAFSLVAGSVVSAGAALGYVLKAAAGTAVCVTNSAAVSVNVLLSYTQF